ncbi:RdgB/HAM1 family non-canonical purine NTP pyrophosphatase [Acidobacteriota bacterium]
MPVALLVATTNPGKARELAAGLSKFFPTLLTLKSYPDIEPLPETGNTFQENAEAKAVFYSEAAGQVCLADDSGLEVDALHGEPGVCSARYGGEGASDADRNRKLLRALEEIPAGRRAARFVCHLALAHKGRVIITVRGELRGHIAFAPRGRHGFGYDPLFIPDGESRTLAEMTPEEKNRISHRADALAKLKSAVAALGDSTLSLFS